MIFYVLGDSIDFKAAIVNSDYGIRRTDYIQFSRLFLLGKDWPLPHAYGDLHVSSALMMSFLREFSSLSLHH